jgi:hypothetical protein
MSSVSFPRVLLVRQNFPDRQIHDVAVEVRRQLVASPFASQLKPGARVAIGVGSRGIDNIAAIVRAAVDYWKENGMHPFIIPVMGSHGAATAEGQADVLAHYGIHERSMGCAVVSQLEVVSLGKTQDGIEAFMDRAAYDADGVMLINRTKWHTDFSGKIESGLFKMMAIGLGKFAGARRYHMYGYKLGLEHVIRSVGRMVLKSGKIVGGLAILEDAYHHTAKLDAVTAEIMEQREEENLALAKSWMAKIPVDLDILVIDEIGKQISGGGMDWKVVNRGFEAERNPYPYVHSFERIFIRDLSPLSYGNSIGLGMAEMVTDRLVDKTEWEPTRINGLTSLGLASIRTPIHLPTDRECLAALMQTVGKFEMNEVTVGRIHNTLELGTIALSENLRPEIEKDPMLEILGAPRSMEFDGDGNLQCLLSEPSEATLGH